MKTLCPIWQPCAARIKDLMSFYNGPTITVVVKLRIVCHGLLLYQKNNDSSAKECERSKTRPGNYSRLDNNQSRGTLLKDNTQTKIKQRFCERYTINTTWMRCATLCPVMLINRKFDISCKPDISRHLKAYFSETIVSKSKMKFCHTVPSPLGGFDGLSPYETKV